MDENKHFQVLVLDYTMAREDERTFQAIQATVAGFAVALLAVTATVASETCKLRKLPRNNPSCKDPPDIFLAAVPSIPLALLAFLELLGLVASLRSYYLRAVEKELRQYTAPLSELEGIGAVRPVSYMGIMTEVTTLRRGRAGYRVLSVMIMFIALFFFGGMTIYIAMELGGRYRIAMLVAYGFAFSILAFDVAAATFGARSTFLKIAKRFVERQSKPILSGAVASGRGLGSYLAIPRPEDWVKWLFIPVVFVITSWSGSSGFRWGRMLIILLIVEYLVYSARYQWNDVRGLKDDAEHPEKRARRRLPISRDAARQRFFVGSSLFLAFLRLIIAGIVGYYTGLLSFALVLTGLVFSVAAVYEFLRAVESAHPVAARGLWLVVGAGYSVRFLAGVVAADMPLGGSMAIAGAVFSFFFGIMFVLLTWVLEGTSYCQADSDNIWHVAGERMQQKAHIISLLKCLIHPEVRKGGMFLLMRSTEDCGDSTILEKRSLAGMPWNKAYLIASVSGALLAACLAHLRPLALIWVIVALSVIGAICVSLSDVPVPAVIFGVAVPVELLLAEALIGGVPGAKNGLLLISPWLITSGTYIGFRQQTYRRLKNFPDLVAEAFEKFAHGTARLVVGSDTWDLIRRR
ncbi:hypothetical protein AB0F13_04115 [Streptomyces sp. NPDC026206]|uniref:hypothetical protein n=1 Tax=Streptomyces sp. NPDC026206 TaxID=3157089 RepID=UPI0034097F2E